MKFPNIEIRKTIALLFAILYVALTIIGFVYDKEIPSTAYSLICIVIGFYFGKSTIQEGITKNQ